MSYDFNKREDFDYTHSYDFFGGVGLGRAEAEAARAREAQRGKYDMEPVDPPSNSAEAESVVKIATLVCKSKERAALVKRVGEVKDVRMEVVWNKKHPHHSYFEWALHCLDREVPDWQSIRKRTGAQAQQGDNEQRKATPQQEVKVGDPVEVGGLKARPELNGKVGSVVSESGDGKRWFVDFSDISQTVSIAKPNCTHTRRKVSADSKTLPRGLKVEITRLTSEQGKLLNGMEAYVCEYSGETQRYSVRLDLTGELKSVKEDNLHVPAPPGWDERFDESTGKKFYVRTSDGHVTWTHPIFQTTKPSKRERESEFVGGAVEPEEESETDEKDAETAFDRNEFLKQEEKRLKLDKKRHAAAPLTAETILERLHLLRQTLGIDPAGGGSTDAKFVGTPKALLDTITGLPESEDRNAWLCIALSLVLEDFNKLRFNKNQLVGLLDKVDQVIEEGSFSDDVEQWICAALKLAIPVSYSIY